MGLRPVLDCAGTHAEDPMNTTRRKITSAEEARLLLDEQRVLGVDIPTFCRERGLDGRSLNCWRLNLARNPSSRGRTEARELRVVEVAWPQAPRPPAAPREGAPRYRLDVGDVVIAVDDDFQEDTLARLLAVVRAC